MVRRTFQNDHEKTFTVTSIKVDVDPDFDVKFVYIKSDGNDVRVYKDRSPEYWTVSDIFMAFVTDIDYVSLYAASDAEVTVYLAG